MADFGIRIEGSNFIIDGLPEGVVKLVSLAQLLPAQSSQLSSLSGHIVDLTFAKTCLSLLNAVDGEGQKGLWRAAVLYYCKCFSQTSKHDASDQAIGSGQITSTNRPGRRPLDPRKVLRGDEEGQEVHRYFMALRNKHLAHDQNGWLQAITAVAIAGPSKGYNVERVLCTTFEANSLEQANVSNLSLLIEKAFSWVHAQHDKVCTYVTNELEKIPREILLSQPVITYKAPTAEEIHLSR